MESAFVFEALVQNCLLGAAVLGALCLQDMYMNQCRDVRCIRVATCTKHTVNQSISRFLSPEILGGGGA